MMTTKIRIQNPEQVGELVNIVSRCPFDVELVSGQVAVDGKSIMGIFSLDFAEPITVRAYSEQCSELMEALLPFSAE